VSDQDFFFDDEQPAEKPAEKPAAKQSGGSKAPASAPRPKASSAPTAVQTVTMTVAGLIAVVALLVGIIIGILIPTGGTQVTSPTTTVPGMGTGTQAPPLSEDAMGGDLPEGHPPIGETDGGEATATPEGE